MLKHTHIKEQKVGIKNISAALFIKRNHSAVLGQYIVSKKKPSVAAASLSNSSCPIPHQLCRSNLQGVHTMQCFAWTYSEGSQSL